MAYSIGPEYILTAKSGNISLLSLGILVFVIYIGMGLYKNMLFSTIILFNFFVHNSNSDKEGDILKWVIIASSKITNLSCMN